VKEYFASSQLETDVKAIEELICTYKSNAGRMNSYYRMENRKIWENACTMSFMEFECKESHTKSVGGRDTSRSLSVDLS
jgi:hypothetical protein